MAFVLIDLDVALTFMDLAGVWGVRETVLRNHKNARTAYDSVLRLLETLTPGLLQQESINEKLAVLKRGCWLSVRHFERGRNLLFVGRQVQDREAAANVAGSMSALTISHSSRT